MPSRDELHAVTTKASLQNGTTTMSMGKYNIRPNKLTQTNNS